MYDFIKVTNQKAFDKHLDEKGLGIIREVAYSLKDFTGKSEITSDEIIGLIRYDKFLREKLYMYLSVTEEFLRNNLYKKLDYSDCNIIMRTSDYDDSDFNLLSDNSYGYNFFKKSKLLFSVILDLYNSFEKHLLESYDFSLTDIENIGNLRNLVMHHSLLVIDQNSTEISKSKINERLQLLDGYLQSLIRVIPPSYKKGLITDINKANLDNDNWGSKSKYICLDFIDGGYK